MNENVIKMARLMVGCKDRTCEDCLSQSKNLFGDGKCALIEYAEVLDKAGYRKRSETVKEFAEKLKDEIAQIVNEPNIGETDEEYESIEDFKNGVNKTSELINDLTEQYGKGEKE